MIKAVIFDFDDTLCLTQDACYRLELKVAKELDIPPVSREFYNRTWGQPFGVSIRQRYPSADPDSVIKKIEELSEIAIEKGEFDIIPSENIEVLDGLAKDGKQLMILTSRHGNGVKHLIDPGHHIGSRVAYVYHTDNNPYHKPDPRTFRIIENTHHLKPAECIYVGDSSVDAAAAKGAGLYFIASLESGIRTEDDFNDYPVDEFINKFTDVPGAVQRIEKRIKS